MLSSSDKLFLLRPICKCEKLFVEGNSGLYRILLSQLSLPVDLITLQNLNGILFSLFQLEISQIYQRLRKYTCFP